MFQIFEKDYKYLNTYNFLNNYNLYKFSFRKTILKNVFNYMKK